MPEDEDVAPTEETTEEVVKHEQHLPTTEERLEHCYDEIRTLRAEIAELRSHSHAELAHGTHEHEQYAASDHQHEINGSEAGNTTSEPTGEHESGGGHSDNGPTATHPYFKKIKFGSR